MRVCRWCGHKIWWPWEYCRMCKGGSHWIHLDLPSPPCSYMARLSRPGEEQTTIGRWLAS